MFPKEYRVNAIKCNYTENLQWIRVLLGSQFLSLYFIVLLDDIPWDINVILLKGL